MFSHMKETKRTPWVGSVHFKMVFKGKDFFFNAILENCHFLVIIANVVPFIHTERPKKSQLLSVALESISK